jgi:hypothetical protein
MNNVSKSSVHHFAFRVTRFILPVVMLVVGTTLPAWGANSGITEDVRGASVTLAPDRSGRVLARTNTAPGTGNQERNVAKPQPGADLPWSSVQIEGPGTCTKGLWMSVAARESSVHLAYWVCKYSAPVQSVVHYALSSDFGATWTVEAVDTSSNYGSGECYMAWFRGGLDLDAEGRPHVAYTVAAPGTGSFCIHAMRLGPNDWRHDTVEMSSNANLICHDADLKIDRDNHAHIAYLYNGHQSRYAVQDDSGWELYDVKSTDTAVGVALALDSIDNPHVVTGGLNEQRYSYSSDGGEDWLTEVVSGPWWHCDIALGADDEPLIVHSVGTMTTGNIWLSRRTGPGNWTHVQVDDGTNNPYRPSVFYDRDEGTIHVAYYGDSFVKHSWSTDNGVIWQNENVTYAYMNSTSNVPDYIHLAPGRYLPYETANPTSGVAMAREISPSCIMDRPLPARGQLSLRVSPTLFTNATTVSYSLPATGIVSLRLYDVNGTLVATLARGCRSAGDHRLTFGHWSSGIGCSRAPRGVYLLKIEFEACGSGLTTATAKLIIK